MNLISYFKALSDNTRLRLINLLIKYELNVNEIVSVLEMGQPRISRHLKILVDCGLIAYRRDGLWIFYTAVRSGDGNDFINLIKPALEKNDEFKSDIERSISIIESRKEETIKFFDSIAGNWSRLKENIIGTFDFSGLIDRYMKKCELAVDIGCGNGDLIPQLLNFADKIIGVDRSGKMLDQAGKLLNKYADRVSLRLGEIEHLPLKDNEADTAVANMVLHHLSSPPEAFKEIHRILKTSGTFMIIDLAKHSNESMRTKYGDRWLGFNDKEITEWLANAGFETEGKAVFEVREGLKLILYIAVKK